MTRVGEQAGIVNQGFVIDEVEGIEAGKFRPNVSPQDAALTLVGFMNGKGLIWVQDPVNFSIKERAEDLVDSFHSGIIAKGSRKNFLHDLRNIRYVYLVYTNRHIPFDKHSKGFKIHFSN